MEALLCNEKTLDMFLSKIKTKSLAHAYLITGPDGSGKKTLASFVAKALCCTGEDIPCGKCSACIKAEHGTHPDIHILKREAGDATIKVDAVRKFIGGTELSPNEADTKIFIIDEAHTLGKEAQNVLLKTLEEPSGSVLFMLLASSEAAVLPTVRSRCMKIAMDKIPSDILAKHLEKKYGVSAPEAMRAARLSGGSVGAAYDALEGKGGFAMREIAFKVLAALASGDKTAALASLCAKSACTKEKLTEIYSYMQLAMRDAAAKDYAKSHAEFFDSTEESERIRRKFTQSRALAFYDVLENEKGEINRNGNPTLSALRVASAI